MNKSFRLWFLLLLGLALSLSVVNAQETPVEQLQDGENIASTVANDGDVIAFLFNSADKALTINTDGSADVAVIAGADGGGDGNQSIDPPLRPASVNQPDLVVIPGTIQSVLGCEGDWQPDCEVTALTYLPEADIWYASFDIPAGDYEYKVAINGSWDVNYGGKADADGPNVTLSLTDDTTVTFIYDHFTHWVADSVNHPILTVPGSFNSEVGCPAEMEVEGDWAPMCLRTWLQDPELDGIYTYATDAILAGDYEAKVAVDLNWTVNYGADGAAGGANIPFSVPEDGTKVVFAFNSSDNRLSIGVGEPAEVGRVVTVNLSRAQAYWVAGNSIAWNAPEGEGVTYQLVYSADASIGVEGGAATGDGAIPLTVNPDGLSADVIEKFPHLARMTALDFSADRAMVQDILRGQFAVVAYDAEGRLIGGTGLQIPGVLDDLFTYGGDLGVIYDGDTPTIRVWAPTAKSMHLHLFADADPATESTVYEMSYDPESGVWSITGEAAWTYQYYLFEVEVYAPSVGRIVNNLVTDPYSFSLSMNSTRSQIVDIYKDTSLMPEGWQTVEKPPLPAMEYVSVYEMHIRDFSVSDPNVPDDLIGTFAAFTVPDSYGMRHLRALANAGLTHLHLLPVFDIATISEDKSTWLNLNFDELRAQGSSSSVAREETARIRDQDPFNWGYDPYHYTVPEGSYSTDPNGTQRILEFRQMVQSLNESGLRLVMDVVYNHTNSAGQSERSVLDRIVPGYYHRLDENGVIATSTCCQNTATEHAMMEKLMIDSLRTWAVAYKVDGFRFDLMGHHMLDNMMNVREMLDSLTVDADGVNGQEIYIYGEGWDFGEVASEARGVNAIQLNIGGTGIGVFNDRLRDAARGGSPFGGQQEQGFIDGLYTDPNGHTPGTEEQQLARLLLFADQVRVGLAGNLANYTFVNADGETVTGADIDYNGNPAGYTLDPQENIVYIAAHDNETLWDIIQYKAPAGTSIAERVRMNNFGVSIVTLSQGVPFFHAGDDMLRSKSLDRDSYNSGDWFNRLDFTYQTNAWGAGLPPSSEAQYNIIRPLLADPRLAVTTSDILGAVMNLREMLTIRASSPLFHLPTQEEVQARLSFHNTGPDQVPGVIVMALSDMVDGMENIDPNYAMIVVVFNGQDAPVTIGDAAFEGLDFQLHVVQASSFDQVVRGAVSNGDGTFTVPGRTTAVFVVPRVD